MSLDIRDTSVICCYVVVFKGYVELVIHPLTPNLQRVCINSKQCRII